MYNKVYNNIIMAKRIRLIIFTVLLLGFIGMSGVAFYFYQKSSSNSVAMVDSKKKEQIAITTPAGLIQAVGKLILLPTGEEPTIATVSDPSKLKDQPFFANAKAGDKVLIYQNAKKAYLYSVTENKLIEVAPINLDAGSKATISTSTTETPVIVKKR